MTATGVSVSPAVFCVTVGRERASGVLPIAISLPSGQAGRADWGLAAMQVPPLASSFIDVVRRVPLLILYVGWVWWVGGGWGWGVQTKNSSFALERLPSACLHLPHPPHLLSLHVSHVPARLPLHPPSLLTVLFQSFHPPSEPPSEELALDESLLVPSVQFVHVRVSRPYVVVV